MSVQPKWRAEVDEAGRLIVPPEVAARYGLKPGAQVQLELSRETATPSLSAAAACGRRGSFSARRSWPPPTPRLGLPDWKTVAILSGPRPWRVTSQPTTP